MRRRLLLACLDPPGSGAAFGPPVVSLTSFLPGACERNHVKDSLTTSAASARIVELRGGLSSQPLVSSSASPLAP